MVFKAPTMGKDAVELHVNPAAEYQCRAIGFWNKPMLFAQRTATGKQPLACCWALGECRTM